MPKMSTDTWCSTFGGIGSGLPPSSITQKQSPCQPGAMAGAVSVVRFLLEHQGLAQRDLIPQFGTESAVAMFLTGQRKLTLKQVQKLSARFKLPADIFIS
jgi:antitoxin component HigA of HigAB toxin-antitoxin module